MTDEAPPGLRPARSPGHDGSPYSAFQTYAATAAWTLTTDEGTKTEYAQFRDGAGNLSPAVSDTVLLETVVADTTSPTVTKFDAVGNRLDARKKPGLQKLTWKFEVG